MGEKITVNWADMQDDSDPDNASSKASREAVFLATTGWESTPQDLLEFDKFMYLATKARADALVQGQLMAQEN